jgi:hypothetical protein
MIKLSLVLESFLSEAKKASRPWRDGVQWQALGSKLANPLDWHDRFECLAAAAFLIGLGGAAVWTVGLSGDVRSVTEPVFLFVLIALVAMVILLIARNGQARRASVRISSWIALVGAMATGIGFTIRWTGSPGWAFAASILLAVIWVWHTLSQMKVARAIIISSVLPLSFWVGVRSIPAHERLFDSPVQEGAWICVVTWLGAASATCILSAVIRYNGKRSPNNM